MQPNKLQPRQQGWIIGKGVSIVSHDYDAILFSNLQANIGVVGSSM